VEKKLTKQITQQMSDALVSLFEYTGIININYKIVSRCIKKIKNIGYLFLISLRVQSKKAPKTIYD